MDTSQFRNGSKIELGGEPFVITYFQHVKPGKGGAFVRTKLRNLKTGRVLERTFRAGEKVEAADVEERKMQYLYADGDSLVFMDCQSFDQIPIPGEHGGHQEVPAGEHGGAGVDPQGFGDQHRAPRLRPPHRHPLRSRPRGDTASGGTKPVTVETGAVVQAPLFIKEGETIRIDTRTGEYVERVNT
jgi:elongation factor P